MSGVGRDSGWTVTRSGRATPSSRLGYHRFAQRRVSTGSIGRSVPLRSVSPSSRITREPRGINGINGKLVSTPHLVDATDREGHVVGSELRDPPSRHSSPRATALPWSPWRSESVPATRREVAARPRSRATHDTLAFRQFRVRVHNRQFPVVRAARASGLAPSVNSVTRREMERAREASLSSLLPAVGCVSLCFLSSSVADCCEERHTRHTWTTTSTEQDLRNVNDPSAGSPTETLLRLLLPLNDQVWSSSRQHRQCRDIAAHQSEDLTKSFNR